MEPARVCSSGASRDCWEALGLDSHIVTAIGATPWGLFAGDFTEGVFRLDSEARAWVSLGLEHAIVSSIEYVPGDTNRVLVGLKPFAREETEAAVFATEDAGQTWLPWDGGLAEENGRRFWAYSLTADPGDPKLLFMGGDAEILRSKDAGRTWEFVHGNATTLALGVNSIVVSPKRDGNIWAAGESAFGTAYVRQSSDWGESWQLFNVNVGTMFRLAIDPSATTTLWGGAPGGVMSSDDTGKTWRVRLRGLIARGIVFLDGGAYVFGTELPEVRSNGHLVAFWSPDRGNSWAALSAPSDVLGAISVALDSQGRILIGTGGSGVWRYTPH